MPRGPSSFNRAPNTGDPTAGLPLFAPVVAGASCSGEVAGASRSGAVSGASRSGEVAVASCSSEVAGASCSGSPARPGSGSEHSPMPSAPAASPPPASAPTSPFGPFRPLPATSPAPPPATPFTSPLLDRALAILAHHRGVSNAITGAQLAAAAGYEGSDGANGTAVRRFRQDLELAYPDLPFPVAATTAGGYYVPVTAEEITHYRRDLLSRASSILSRLAGFEVQLSRAAHHDTTTIATEGPSAPHTRLIALDRLLRHCDALSL